MMRILDLKFLFSLVAIVELFYGLAGLLIPPSLILPILGWQLSPDGQWVTKLLGLSLLIQAALAWSLRERPPLAVAWILGAYQIGASGVDLWMWWLLADQGIFATTAARLSVLTAIPTHFLLGLLLCLAARRAAKAGQHA